MLSACGGADSRAGAVPASATSTASTSSTAAAPAPVTAKTAHQGYVVHHIVDAGSLAPTRSLSGSGYVIGHYTPPGAPQGRLRPFIWSAVSGLREIPGLVSDDSEGEFVPTVYAVNDAGAVVGSAEPERGSWRQPFGWSQDSGSRQLPGIYPDGGPRATVGIASDINNAGQIVGRQIYDARLGVAMYWGSGMDQIATATVTQMRIAPSLERISGNGLAIGARDAGRFGYFLWQLGEGERRVPDLPQFNPFLTAVSDSGYVAGVYAERGDANEQAGGAARDHLSILLIDPAGQVHLAPIKPTHAASTTGDLPSTRVSEGGAAVTEAQVDGRPFYWTVDGGVRDILGEAGTAGQSRSIGPTGTVVGWFQASAEAPKAAFAWSDSAGFVDLNQRIGADAGLHIDEALEVNAAGMVLASAGTALVLLVPADDVPEPDGPADPVDPVDPVEPGAGDTGVSTGP